MLVIEDAVGFICHYAVVSNGVLDQDVLVPAMTKLQARVGGKIERASFDRGFHTPENQQGLAAIVAHPCIPKKGHTSGRQQQEDATVEFRQARQRHPGMESAIGALQAGNGQERAAIEQTRLRALRGLGDPGPQSAGIRQAALRARQREVRVGQIETQEAGRLKGRRVSPHPKREERTHQASDTAPTKTSLSAASARRQSRCNRVPASNGRGDRSTKNAHFRTGTSH